MVKSKNKSKEKTQNMLKSSHRLVEKIFMIMKKKKIDEIQNRLSRPPIVHEDSRRTKKLWRKKLYNEQ